MPTLLRIEIWGLLVGLAIVVFYRMLTGTINTKRLLHNKGGRSGFSPGRLQLLMSTMAFVFYYIGQLLSNAKTGEFPAVPREMLLLLGGSHLFYLGGKAFGMLSETLGVSKNKSKNS